MALMHYGNSPESQYFSYRFLVVDGGLLNDQVVTSRGSLSFLTEKNEKEIRILQGRDS